MKTLELEVFRAGDYGERGHWGEEVLDQMAEDYDPSLHEAPVTVDHAQSGPALGWVESLRRVGAVLVARLRGLDSGFAEMVRRGSFKKRSVEIYRSLQETGRPYLRAVSFLGACPPAVKGLRDVVFAEGDGDPVSIESAEPEGEGPDAGWDRLRERLMAGGRWLPTWEERGLCAFWEGLAGEEERSWFAEFLESLPPLVPTRGLGEDHGAPPRRAEGVPLSTPRAEVSSASVNLHRQTVAFREEHPETNYAEALRAVARGV